VKGELDKYGMEIVLQPAQSPDLNVLDLGFFNSIQSLQQRNRCTGIDELVENTKKAFEEEPWEVLDRVFQTLQGCMHCILEREGGNNFKIPHMKKEMKDQMVANLVCDLELLKKCERMVNNIGNPNFP